MIVITSVDYIEIEKDENLLKPWHNENTVIAKSQQGEQFTFRKLNSLTCGRRYFTGPLGESVLLGNDPDVQKLIGIQHNAWNVLETEMSEMKTLSGKLHHRINTANYSSFWTRLKWLFTGCNI